MFLGGKQIILHTIILLEHPIVALLVVHVLIIVLRVHIIIMQKMMTIIGKAILPCMQVIVIKCDFTYRQKGKQVLMMKDWSRLPELKRSNIISF